MNGDRLSLTFVCVDCGRVLVVRVPKARGVFPGRYPWRCFQCQGSRPDGAPGATGATGRIADGSEPSKGEEK
jgi:predicted RNA-binding Zn-ribbon protein involved in translation (DUF1610 family)